MADRPEDFEPRRPRDERRRPRPRYGDSPRSGERQHRGPDDGWFDQDPQATERMSPPPRDDAPRSARGHQPPPGHRPRRVNTRQGGARQDPRSTQRFDGAGYAAGAYGSEHERRPSGARPQETERYDSPRGNETRVMPVGGARGHDPYDDRGGWSEQRGHRPPPRDHGRRPGPPPGGAPPRKRRRARPVHWFRRIALLLVVLLVAYVAWMAIAINGAFGEINKIDAMPDHSDRPGSADGRNYVLVGSDSREDLSPEDRRRLGTGGAEGARTDSIMLLHIPDGGDPTLMSLPRDLWVPIRDAGEGKINASYAIGGPKLLVDTVEQTTGVPIDGYMEIGFGGFANVVDAVNGVEMCLDEPINDEKAHIDLPAGCQTLDGVNALGYVRMRYSDPRGDLGRAERQREFLGALSKKAATPANLLLPWRVRSVGGDIAKSLTIDDGMGMKETFDVLWAVRKAGSGGRSMLAPVSDEPYRAPNGSIAVQWDEAKKQKVFDAIRNGDDATAFD